MSDILCRTCGTVITYEAPHRPNPASMDRIVNGAWVDATGGDGCDLDMPHMPPSTRYSIAKQVVATHSYMPGPVFEGVMLDATTANAIVVVCEALSPKNLERVDGIPLPRFIDFVWKSVRPA